MVAQHVCFLAALVAAAPAVAQEDYRVEVFGGFAHQRGDAIADHRNGWVASQTTYLRPWIGVEVELSGLYGKYDQGPFLDKPATRGLDDDRQSYLAGPRFRLLSSNHVTLGAHALFGVSQSHFEANLFFEELPFGVPTQGNSSRFGGVIGPSIDVHLTERFSWRIQPDWAFRDGSGIDNSLRLTTGFVFRFGR